MPRWRRDALASLAQAERDRWDMMDRARQASPSVVTPRPPTRPPTNFYYPNTYYYGWPNTTVTTAVSQLGQAFTTFANTASTAATTISQWDLTINPYAFNANPGYVTDGTPGNIPVVTEEQRAAQAAARKKTEIMRGRAIRRGRKLLMALLDDEQLESYARSGTFVVVGQSGTKYRIRKNRTILELSSCGDVIASLCVHLTYAYIAEDNLIAQMMLLQHDEEGIRALANITAYAPGIARGLPSYRRSDGGVLLRAAA